LWFINREGDIMAEENTNTDTISTRHTIQNLDNKLESLTKDPRIGDLFFESIENLLKVYEAIIENKGNKGWTNALDENVLSENEKESFEKAVQPLVEFIIKKVYNIDIHTNNNSQSQKNNHLPTNTFLDDIIDYIEEKQEESTQVGGNGESTTQYGIDELYESFLDVFRQLDEKAKTISESQYGLTQFEKSIPTSVDIQVPNPLFPTFAIPPITFPLPVNTAIFFGYLLLDIARVIVSSPIADIKFLRITFSIILAIIDLLRGDWKKAVLSISGVFNKYYVYIGAVGKISLNLFGLLSPDIRESLTYGTLDVLKSFIIGSLLSLFHTFAPYPIRQPVVIALTKLNEYIDTVNESLEENKLPKLPEYMSADFQNLSDIQIFFSDSRIVCTDEFQSLVASLSQTVIIRIVFQLLRIPMTKPQLERKCPEGAPKPANEILAEIQMDIKNKELENIQETSPKVTQETPQEKIEQPITSQTQTGGKITQIRKYRYNHQSR
jgi:hypothetical protein